MSLCLQKLLRIKTIWNIFSFNVTFHFEVGMIFFFLELVYFKTNELLKFKYLKYQ